MKKPWVLSCQWSAQRRLWSDWADAKVDPSLRWVHSHFVGFVMRRLNCFPPFVSRSHWCIVWLANNALFMTTCLFVCLLPKCLFSDVDIPETCDFIYTQCEKGFEYFLDDGEGFPAIKYKPFCVYVPDLKSNANGSEGETASPPRTTASILVQPLPSENNRTSKWPTNNGRAHQEPSAPPPENTVPSKQSSTNLPAAQEPSASTASSDYLPTYEEAIAKDSGVKK